MTTQTIATKADIVIGTVAASTPMWLAPAWLENIYMGYMMAGGAILVTIRVALSVREWLRGPPPSQ